METRYFPGPEGIHRVQQNPALARRLWNRDLRGIESAPGGSESISRDFDVAREADTVKTPRGGQRPARRADAGRRDHRARKDTPKHAIRDIGRS
jgi:hypothetical protein